MFKNAAILSLSLLVATPALANDSLAVQMGYEPGEYNTSELVQIMFAENLDATIQTIHRNRAAFNAEVAAAAAHLLGTTSVSASN